MIITVGIPKPYNFARADSSVGSAAVEDGSLTSDDVSTTLINGFTAKTAPVSADSVALVDSAATNVNKKATAANLTKGLSPNALTAKTAPVAADEIILGDTEASNVAKKVTLANATKGLSPNGLTAKTAPASADELILGDTEASNVAKKVTAGNLTKALSISSVTAKTAPIAADATIINDSAASNVAKSVTLANMAAFYNAVAQMGDDLANSLFFHAVELDCNSANAVDTKVTDAAVAKGKLLLALAVVTEGYNGDADTTIVISSAAGGATAMAGTITIDKDAAAGANFVGGMAGAMPVSGANAIVASGGDVYAYAAAKTGRSTGKAYIFTVWQKTA